MSQLFLKQATRAASLLNEQPIAIGLKPPSFFERAQREAPKNMARTSSLILPARIKLHNFVMAAEGTFTSFSSRKRDHILQKLRSHTLITNITFRSNCQQI
jgi:hypothetical protein